MVKNDKYLMTVDDSRLIRSIIGDIAQELGFKVIEATTADEAVELYKKFKPDIVFMDIILEGRNGIEALKDIKDYDKEAKVVICTSIIGQENIIQKARDFGAMAYITKPFKEDEIYETIRKIA